VSMPSFLVCLARLFSVTAFTPSSLFCLVVIRAIVDVHDVYEIMRDALVLPNSQNDSKTLNLQCDTLNVSYELPIMIWCL
jgi:hypothetical protein